MGAKLKKNCLRENIREEFSNRSEKSLRLALFFSVSFLFFSFLSQFASEMFDVIL